jgi:hypothetical protein
VTVTKKGVAEVPRKAASTTSSSQSRAKQDEGEQDTAEKLLDQVREALQDVGQTASGWLVRLTPRASAICGKPVNAIARLSNTTRRLNERSGSAQRRTR